MELVLILDVLWVQIRQTPIINHTHSGPSGNAGSDSTKKGGGNRDSNTGTYTTLEQAGGANETRPKNIALMYCIKS